MAKGKKKMCLFTSQLASCSYWASDEQKKSGCPSSFKDSKSIQLACWIIRTMIETADSVTVVFETTATVAHELVKLVINISEIHFPDKGKLKEQRAFYILHYSCKPKADA